MKPGQFGSHEDHSNLVNELSFYTYESTDTSQWENGTLANTIMTSWYNENEMYNFKAESKFQTAGKNVITNNKYTMFISNFVF